MNDWPKYFLHYHSKNGYGYWKFLSEEDRGKYFYHDFRNNCKGTQESIYAFWQINKERFKSVSEEALILVLLGGDNALS